MSVFVYGCGGRASNALDTGLDPKRPLSSLTETEGSRVCALSLEYLNSTLGLTDLYCRERGRAAGAPGKTNDQIRSLCRLVYEECLRSVSPEAATDLLRPVTVCFDHFPVSSQCMASVADLEACFGDAIVAAGELPFSCETLTTADYPPRPRLEQPASCLGIEARCPEIF